MKRFFTAALLLTSTACSQAFITMPRFDDIPHGASAKEVQTSLGEPYEVQRPHPGEEIYLYIERIDTGARVQEQRHYTLRFVNGRLVSKDIEHKESKHPVMYSQ